MRTRGFRRTPAASRSIRVKSGEGPEKLAIEATRQEGNQASSSLQLDSRSGQEQILLRTERAVYRAGDPCGWRFSPPNRAGHAYVDVVKEGQTMLTRDVDIVDGHAELALTATPELAGTLDFNAYSFGRDAIPVADHRLVFVQPADELKIEATADAAVYKPGDDARIRFRVTNSKGRRRAGGAGTSGGGRGGVCAGREAAGVRQGIFLPGAGGA